MLKNEIMKLTEISKDPKYSKLFFDSEEDIFSFIEKLPTIQKIFIVQNLLKEMISLNDLFIDNKNNMIKKMNITCYKYFKNTISIKQIFDYCELNNPEKIINYILLKDEEADDALHWFEEGKKNFIENFFFGLRNDYTLMLKIINEIEQKYYNQLGYFLTNFLYENTASSSFTQEELILIIYLVMENTIFNQFPMHFSTEFLINLNSEKTDYFLYFLIQNLTKKTEIRNYLSNILHDLIVQIENMNKKLDVNISTIMKDIFDNANNENKETRRKSLFDIQMENGELNNNNNNMGYLRTKSMMPLNNDFMVNNDRDNINKNNNAHVEENNNKDIYTLFEENNLTKSELSKILNNLSKNKKSEIENAFLEYLLFIQNELTKEKNVQIFSIDMIAQIMMDEKEKNKIIGTPNEEKIDETLKNNFFIIIGFIKSLFDKILQSLTSLPYTIKCIFFFLDKLISKKYQEKKDITPYQILMIKLKLFFEGFILPVLENPLYNGLISDGVISNTTLENLKIISKIVEKFVSSNLFKIYNDNSNPFYTLFNKFIVDQMMNLFNIGVEIDKNIKHKFEPPNAVMQLIEFNEFNDISVINDTNGRNINYDFFNYNNKESIQFQSVCFSYSDLLMFIYTVDKPSIRNYLENNKNNIYSDFKLVYKYRKHFNETYTENVAKNKLDFIFVTNLKYKESFLNNIKAVTEEHFDNYFKYEKNNSKINEKLLLFKKCLIEVMSFINEINKENFKSFIKSKNDLILNSNSHINKFFTQKKLFKYNNTIFEGSNKPNKINPIDAENIPKNNLSNHLNKTCLSFDLMEDADFLKEIFPKIIDILKYQIGNSSNYERIIFCITYLQINIKNLPLESTNNNYSKLFIDIIKDILNLLKSLQNNILNQFYLKIREGEKLNLIFSKYSSEIKSMEKYYTVNFIFNKLILPIPVKDQIKKEKSFKNEKQNLEPIKRALSLQTEKTISNFIINFEDFGEFSEEIDDILLHENKEGIPKMIKNYFKEINNLTKKEPSVMKYSNSEYISSICYDLENYILLKLYKKLFPSFPSKSDEFIYNKCVRLNFIKPGNIITDIKMINDNLLLKATEYINNIDEKYTPIDKIKMFGKAFQILQNTMTFSSGKSDFGIDDTLPFLIYLMIKAKPKMLNSNYIFCKYYINPELEKKEYGILMMQIGAVIRIICDMKYTELKGVTKEQFGVDEELPPGLIDSKNKEQNKM